MEKSGRHREFWGLYGEIPRKKLNKVEAREPLPTCGHAAQICPDHSMLLSGNDSCEASCCTQGANRSAAYMLVDQRAMLRLDSGPGTGRAYIGRAQS